MFRSQWKLLHGFFTEVNRVKNPWSCRTVPVAWASCGRLRVRLHEPKPFVYPARNLREYVRSGRIVELLRFTDGGSCLMTKCGKRSDHRVNVRHSV